jgi:hypothetical protein
MPSDPKRVHQAYLHIERIKASDYPQVVGSSDDRDGGYKIVERSWKAIPEPSKLAMLLDAVDWSGITNRDRAHMLLAEIDPGQISDDQRRRLVEMAVAKERPQLSGEEAFNRLLDERWQTPAREVNGKNQGIER